jgi:protoheme IX farnesyltransferase
MSSPIAIVPPTDAEHPLCAASIVPAPGVRDRLDVVSALIELTKPRVVTMVLVTTAVGFYLGRSAAPNWVLLAYTLIGTALAAGGTLALNQYLERDADAQMRRTQKRPLPSGRLQPIEALVFGAGTTACGLIVLTALATPLSALVTATTVITYLGLYTPMKRTTPLCGVVGAIPGALPPVTGWVAAQGGFGPGAWALFAILFLWQLPHSLAIAQLYAEDYARAGFRLLPIVDRNGRSTERQIVINCIALLAVGLAPTLVGVAGALYFAVALLLGGAFLACAIAGAVHPSAAAARRVMFASLVYLPALLACMAWDKVAVG